MEQIDDKPRTPSDDIKRDLTSLTGNQKAGAFTTFRYFISNRGFRAIYIARWRRYHSLRRNQARLLLWRIMDAVLDGYVFIEEKAKIGPGFTIVHPIAVAIGGCEIGSNCTVYQGVSIGANYRSEGGKAYPTIGDNVRISPGAVILGPINIGSNVVVAANAVVVNDVPDNSVVGGVPAKIIGQYDAERFGAPSL